jgi:hypothetical protein
MKALRSLALSVGLLASLLAAACGGGSHGEEHGAERGTPAPPPPTADTTPIEALRTPAGLALRVTEGKTPTPAPAITGSPTSPAP